MPGPRFSFCYNLCGRSLLLILVQKKLQVSSTNNHNSKWNNLQYLSTSFSRLEKRDSNPTLPSWRDTVRPECNSIYGHALNSNHHQPSSPKDAAFILFSLARLYSNSTLSFISQRPRNTGKPIKVLWKPIKDVRTGMSVMQVQAKPTDVRGWALWLGRLFWPKQAGSSDKKECHLLTESRRSHFPLQWSLLMWCISS